MEGDRVAEVSRRLTACRTGRSTMRRGRCRLTSLRAGHPAILGPHIGGFRAPRRLPGFEQHRAETTIAGNRAHGQAFASTLLVGQGQTDPLRHGFAPEGVRGGANFG